MCTIYISDYEQLADDNEKWALTVTDNDSWYTLLHKWQHHPRMLRDSCSLFKATAPWWPVHLHGARGLDLTKFTNFTVVYLSDIRSNVLHVHYQSTMSHHRGLWTICAEANTFWTQKSIWLYQGVQHSENVLPSCHCFKWFTLHNISLIDHSWIYQTYTYQELHKAGSNWLTHPAIVQRIYWTVCEVAVPKHPLPFHWYVMKQYCFMKAWYVFFLGLFLQHHPSHIQERLGRAHADRCILDHMPTIGSTDRYHSGRGLTLFNHLSIFTQPPEWAPAFLHSALEKERRESVKEKSWVRSWSQTINQAS